MTETEAMQIVTKFVDKWRSKGYSEKGEFAVFCIACSKEGVERYGSEKQAVDRLIEVIESTDNEQAVIDIFVTEVIGEDL